VKLKTKAFPREMAEVLATSPSIGLRR